MTYLTPDANPRVVEEVSIACIVVVERGSIGCCYRYPLRWDSGVGEVGESEKRERRLGRSKG